jgi:hypothetical protein
LFKSWLIAGFIGLLLFGWLLQVDRLGRSVFAQGQINPQTTPEAEEKAPRTAKITVAFTSYKWWLVRYSNNNIACSFSIEHEGLPVAGDIEALCEAKTYNEWITTPACKLENFSTNLNQCPGFYLHPLDSSASEKEITIELPPPSVWVTITNCNPLPPDGRCTTLPILRLTAEEPLPNETIINVQGTIAGEPFICMGNTCNVPLKPTGMDGTIVEFWADSSFGDSTERYTARVRLVPWGDFMNPEQASRDPRAWYVDILSSQWRDGKLATCSDTWQVFPSIGGPPDWLQSPVQEADLQTDISYYYLAGSLITYGIVDASGCVDGGLQAPNIGSPCGVEAARPQLVEWQNRFDGEILQAANDTGVPSLLLKNVFARESQIWPGIYKTYKEAGLGQLTSNGADTVLLWNPNFFGQFCPFVLDKKYCEKGFGNLGEFEQNLLRGALVRKVNASCPDCPAGIDLSRADYSVHVFAEGMLANCEQVGRIITNITDLNAGQTTSYEDLWRFSLVNYNAGPGCLSNAINQAWFANQPLDWATITAYLEPACQGSIGYVEDISRILKATPTPTPWIPNDQSLPTPAMPRVVVTPTQNPPVFYRTPTMTSTPAPVTPTITQTPVTFTPTITNTPTVTATQDPYALPTDTLVPQSTPTSLNQ